MSGQAVDVWRPRHDQVVALHLMGYKGFEIAQLLEYSEEHISRILNDPRAIKAVRMGRSRFMEHAHAEIDGMLLSFAHTGLRRMKTTVEGEFAAGTRAKEHQDRVTFELLGRVGYGKASKDQDAGTIKLSRDLEERLVTAMEKSNTANEIIVEAEVLEDATTTNGGRPAAN